MSRISSDPPYFHPDSIPNRRRYLEVGQHPDRPFMILATIAETALGDLLCKTTFASNLKDQFDHARLIVRYNDFRPYSSDVIRLSPNIDYAEPLHGELPRWLRKYVRDGRLWRPLTGAISRSGRFHEAFYDFVLVDSMASARTVHTFDPLTPLRVPPELREVLTRRLTELGLEANHNFAVVHYRDGSYALKSSNPVRNGNPESYRQAIDHIIERLDCQVVQIGHPEMKPFPKRDGLVDISGIRNEFMLQAFAVARSRFMIGGASGPTSLGWSFGIPTAVCDCAEANSTWGSKHNVYLTHEVTTPDGEVLRNQALHDRGLLDIRELTARLRRGEKFTLRKNSGDEISVVAAYLHKNSTDVTGWREDLPSPIRARPNSITWPPRLSWNAKFLDV